MGTTAALALVLGASVVAAAPAGAGRAVAAIPAAAVAAPAVPGALPPVDLAALDPTPVRQWGVVGTGTSSSAPKPQVWDFAEIGDRIYVAGTFTGVQRNGDDVNSTVQAQAYLAAFERDSGAWVPTFKPVLDRAVQALAVSPDGNLLVGGEFTTVNGVARTGLVMLDPATGATVPSFTASIQADTDPMVRRIVREGDRIYVAGQIARVLQGSTSTWVWNAARLDARTGALDTTWIPKFMGGLWDIAIDAGRDRVHGAGFFTSVDGRPGTARLGTVSRTTGAPVAGLTAYAPNSTGQQDTVAVVYAADRIYVGGAQHVVQVLDAGTNARLGFHTTGIACDLISPDGCGYAGGGDFQVLRLTENGLVLGGCHCNDASGAYAGKALYSSFTNSRRDKRLLIDFRASDSLVASSFVPGLKYQSLGTYSIGTDSRGCLYVGGDYVRMANGSWLGGFGRFCRPVAAVGGLTAGTAGGRVTLNWSAAATQLPVAYHKVYRDGVFLGDTVGRVFGVGGLTPGDTHTFTVRTMDVSGRLSADASVTVTVAGGDTTAPTAPVTPVAAVAGTSVTLTWGASSDLPATGGIGLSGYLVHRDWQFVKFVPAGTTTFTDTGLTAGSHRYEVRAVDLANNMSAAATVTATIADTEAPTTPGDATATVSGTTVTLRWNAATDLPATGGSGISGYLVHRDWQFLRFVPTGTATFTDTGVTAGAHRYEVRAVDRANNFSAPTPPMNVTVG